MLFLSTALALGIVNGVSAQNSVSAIKNGEIMTEKYELDAGYSNGYAANRYVGGESEEKACVVYNN